MLVGLDDTSYSWLAADWAAAEAQMRGCALRVVHAVGRGAERAYGETGVGLTEQVLQGALGVLDDARARLEAAHPGVPIEGTLARDDPADALLTAAEDADMIVVGTRGRGGFAGLLLGSVSLKVAAHADAPVVVVRGETGKAAGGGVVVGVRDDRDEEAVRFALAEADLRQADVRLVHAWTPLAHTGLVVPQVSHLEEERDAHARLLNHAARPVAEYPTVHVDSELIVGSPAGALVEASARAGMVVLPRHPVEGRFGQRLGAVVHAVLHHAVCPVAVVPAG
ncbi:universal stress protein [Streptomyces viridochromogenes]|uniref:Putative Universal stress family domain-containing protein n=1 Tax=Streptomyces viridochromogenes Tue57 TaxID=1160705 RepID=L8PPH3_STRVR|nr:universal stress protein [Streptomyces viridochromogenes]ELS58400.1 putative Universal stress family domain-containing protein [Streptomyces viridochromogenes Tue57]